MDTWSAPVVLLFMFAVVALAAVGLARFQPKEWDQTVGRMAVTVGLTVLILGFGFGFAAVVAFFVFGI